MVEKRIEFQFGSQFRAKFGNQRQKKQEQIFKSTHSLQYKSFTI